MTKVKFLKIAIRSTLLFIMALSKKRYWYQVNVYFIKNGNVISKRTVKVGMLFRRDILDNRAIGKTLGKDFYKDRSLYGSTMSFQVVAYIGRLKNTEEKNEQID